MAYFENRVEYFGEDLTLCKRSLATAFPNVKSHCNDDSAKCYRALGWIVRALRAGNRHAELDSASILQRAR